MIFLAEHAELIKQGRKWQTRRLVKEHDRIRHQSNGQIISVSRNARLLWCIGQDYAIQPGRCKPALCRRRLLSIRREQLFEITAEDCQAEGIGCENRHGILWTRNDAGGWMPPRGAFARLWDSIHSKKGACWQDNPEVWVLEFKREIDQ